MPQLSTDVQTSPLETSYDNTIHQSSPIPHANGDTSRWLTFWRYNVVQRILSAAILASVVTVFLWLSPAIATSTVCSFMTSTCSYEYACLANRIRLRILSRLEFMENLNLRREVDASNASQQETRSNSERSSSFVGSRSVNFDVTASLLDSTADAHLHPRLSSDGYKYDAPRTSTTRAFEVEQEARELARVNSELVKQAPSLRRYAITDVATDVFGGRTWLATLCVSTLLCTLSSCVFLVVIEGFPVLASTELYESRLFYTVATDFVAAVCACVSPDWQYAVIILLQNVIFTILTIYSMACPINQLSCHVALNPLQVFLTGIVLFLVFRLATCRSNAEALLTFMLDALGLVYIIGTISVLVAFVDDKRQTLYRKVLIALLYVVWASDTGAYMTGKLLTLVNYPYYNPLAAHLSKDKDYEGTVGAIGFGIVAMVVSWHLLELPGSVSTNVAIAVVAVIIGRLGDLFESLLKRAAGVKHSGTLIPGHGGVLDRIDGLMFATLVFSRYYAIVY